jgi:hypothetical protein
VLHTTQGHVRRFRDFLDSTRGIIFLSVPHEGSGLEKYAEVLAKIAGLFKETNLVNLQIVKLQVKDRQKDSEELAIGSIGE